MKSRHGMMLGAAEIEAVLAKKFAPPEYAFMPQMNQGTGSSAGRRADAVAFSLWPSRGLTLTGFEIKVSRNDLATELRNPAKAEAIQQFCDFWYLVTPAGLTTDMDLLPATWGLMEVAGGTVKVKKQAPKCDASPMTRAIIASMFRAFHETVPYLQANFVCVDDLKAEIETRAQDLAATHRRDRSDALETLQATVKAFEEASGVSISDRWEAGRIGGVVHAIVKAGGPWQLDRMLVHEQTKLHDALAGVDSALEALRRPEPEAES